MSVPQQVSTYILAERSQRSWTRKSSPHGHRWLSCEGAEGQLAPCSCKVLLFSLVELNFLTTEQRRGQHLWGKHSGPKYAMTIVQTTHLRILLKCWHWLGRSWWGLKFCISIRKPWDAAGLQSSLWLPRISWGHEKDSEPPNFCFLGSIFFPIPLSGP